MHYVQPKLTGTFAATSTIQGIKFSSPYEGDTDNYSVPAAYEADE
jgi:hypothetical protein